MTRTLLSSAGAGLFCVISAIGQNPIYRVTVIERSVDAINYQYRSFPTKIDFRGTVLMPSAKGEANVESRRGRTEIDAKFEKLSPPAPFGREYMTYVLWAISPEGAPHNLGEIIPNGSDNARMHVSTQLQAFGLIVTAEPFAAVRQPSDVVVMENRVRPETIGKTEPIQAKYELMPRGHYTLEKAANPVVNEGPKVSMDEYEQLLEVYQAENAINMARAAGADQYAADTLAKAQQLLAEAHRLRAGKAGVSLVVQNAREAAQMAEDARVIAGKRKDADKLASVQREADLERQARARAEAQARQAQADAEAARVAADNERLARERAEADAVAAPPPPRTTTTTQVVQVERTQPAAPPVSTQKNDYRAQLFARLKAVLPALDTPRGIVVFLKDSEFTGGELRSSAFEQVSRVANTVGPAGLHVMVEGYTDSPATDSQAARRADVVANALRASGVPANAVSAQGMGSARPLESNATQFGRTENRRVEIVISGDAIGNNPAWDRSYSLSSR